MVDDNTPRSYRSNDPNRRDSAPADAGGHGSGSDPLAELARLIGQSDPFADFGRNKAGPQAPQQPQAPVAQPGASDWRSTPPSSAFEALRRLPSTVAEQHAEPSYTRDLYQTPSSTGHGSPGAMAEPPAGGPFADDGYQDDRDFAAPEPVQYEQQHQPYQQLREPQQHPQTQQPHRDDPRYEAIARDAYESTRYQRDDAEAPHPEEDIYDDAPRARRHGGLVTAVLLIGCAMLGTAGAYGYRTYYSGAASTSAPPVIVADKTPSKIAPAETSTNKLIQDRVDPLLGSGERLVSREEQPVPLRDPPSPQNPRVILPAPIAPNQGAGAAAPAEPPPAVQAAAPPSSPPAAAGSGEPKRVRTVTIRADGSEIAARPATAAPPPVAAPVAQAANPPAAAVRPAVRSVQTPPRQTGAPLSLDPQALSSEAAAPPAAPSPARTRVATAPPQSPQLASAPPAGGGNYLVQVSSQRSEAEAHSSFRSLQAKFPSALGGRSHVVRRADLGDRGIFYRAMVGPFGSSDEAARFCGQLKAAGGQCLIQRN